MSETIYVLIEGSYSEYCIIGVYSTEKLAEKAKNFCYPNSEIEEYTLNHIPDHPPGMKAWSSRFCNGKLECTYQQSINYFEEREYEFLSKYNPESSVYFNVYCWAVDREHAEKIAWDKYYQYQAQKSGIS